MSTSLRLQDRFTLDLKFNGAPYPLHPKTVKIISQNENIKNNMPTCDIKLYDQTGKLMNTEPLRDGDKINITASDDQGTEEGAEFSLFSHKGEPSIDSMKVEVVGILNHPRYFRGTADKAIKGTTGDAISKLAQQCGLQPVVDKFQDSQLWIPLHDKIWEFAHKMCDSGWAGEKGATSLGVDLTSRLHYRDLAQVVKQAPSKKLVYGGEEGEGHMSVLHWGLESYSGPLNSMGGYSGVTHQLGLDGVMSNFEKVAVSMFEGGAVNIGKAISEAIGTAQIRYLPTDSGNTHKNFAQAQHTNKRGRAAYSLNVHVLLDQISGLHLYDVVDLLIYENVNSPVRVRNQAYSGRYFVSARTIHVDGFKYRERIELSAQGPSGG